MLSEEHVTITGGAFPTRACPWVLMLRTFDETFRAVEAEVSTPRCRYGQAGGLVRKPSPVRDIAQWCLPSRRQHAGVLLGCACTRGRTKPKHNSASSKLAGTRRISKWILLHHKPL